MLPPAYVSMSSATVYKGGSEQSNAGIKSVRILHTADIHLGDANGEVCCGTPTHAPYYHPCTVLHALVDYSLQAKVDLIIVAGDLFDHNRVDAATLEFASEQLKRAVVPVLILPGNHDCLTPDSVYHRIDFSRSAPNVSVFARPEGQGFSFPNLDLAVWGKPVTDYGGGLRPMSGVPPRGAERWQVAVAHGHYIRGSLPGTDSYPIYHEELVNSGRDYVALGHWSNFYCVCQAPVKAFYCGAAVETGTCAIVDFLANEIRVRRHTVTPAKIA